MSQFKKILDLIERLRGDGEEFCVATVVRTADLTSAKAGAKAVVMKGDEILGFVGGACVTRAVRDAARLALKTGEPQLIRVRPKEDVQAATDKDGLQLYGSSCPSGGTVEIFVEPMRRTRRLVICGAATVAQALVGIAKAAGLEVIVAAPRGDHDRIPGAAAYLDGFDLGRLDLRPEDSVVVATQGERDRAAIVGALASPARYVSMVGSSRKVAKLKADLATEGTVPAERIAALKGPAGFDIGAVGPEEIALSIAAEVIAFLRQSTGSLETMAGTSSG